MRTHSIWLIVVVSAAALAVVWLSGAAQPESEADRRVRALIEQLGDDAYVRREAASKELEELSDEALPALRVAAQHRDPEIRLRARQLVAAIGLHLRESKTNGLTMVGIEPGEFTMGSPEVEPGRQAEEVQHLVRITRPFLLGVHEVTQGEFAKVMLNQPSWFSPGGGGKEKIAGKFRAEGTARYPVDSVTWFEAIEFCNRLSALDGFEPYYTLSDIKREREAIVAATVKVAGGKGYRLPTEAEWEYASRAGSSSPFWFGTENTGREANVKPVTVAGGYGGDVSKWKEIGHTIDVGGFPANKWGLHDTHGNVAEWCWDWYDKDYYHTSPKVDPAGPAAGDHRVLRGGSWMVLEGSCRSASRFWHTPNERKNYVGFRVARDQ